MSITKSYCHNSISFLSRYSVIAIVIPIVIVIRKTEPGANERIFHVDGRPAYGNHDYGGVPHAGKKLEGVAMDLLSMS